MIDNPRFELLVAKHQRQLVVGLLAVGVLSVLAMGVVLATPGTYTTTEQVGEETVETSMGTSAEVVRDGLWNEGETLEDSSAYMLDDTPELTIEPATTVDGDEGPPDDADVHHEVTLRYEAERDDVFWEDRVSVLDDSPALESGTGTSAATIDVTEVRERVVELEDELGEVASVTAKIDLVVSYDTGTNEGELRDETELTVTEEAYWMEGTVADEESHREEAQVEVQESPNYTSVGLLAILAVLSIAAAGWIYRQPEADAERARRRIHERRYAEWISRGSLPMWIGEHQLALDSLEDVVDVAIDTNERVVHDRQRDLFAVVNDDVVYFYSEHGQWGETAWPTVEINHREDATPPQPEGGERPGDRPDGVGANPGRGDSDPHDAEADPGDVEANPDDVEPDTDGIGSDLPDPEELPDPEDDDAWEQL